MWAMNPRCNTILGHTAARGRGGGVLVVLTKQVILGGQLVAIYRDDDVEKLKAKGPAPRPRRVAFVDFHHADPERYERLGSLPDAAERVLGVARGGVPAIKTKVLLEPIDTLGRAAGGYVFDESLTSASILARVRRGGLSLVPVYGDDAGVEGNGPEETEALRTMRAEQKRAVSRKRFYFAVTPHDQPFSMLEVLPATKAAAVSELHEVPHESINVDLIWDS